VPTHEHIDRTALREAVSPVAEDAVVTMYEQLIEEGRQKGLAQGVEKGLQKGRAEGRAEALLQLLAMKFGRVPVAVREQVRDAPATSLTQWTKRVLAARTLDAVFAAAPARNAARAAAPKKTARR
jgi:flagellar biosynthesis/type III secretory pathway protein FliH